MPEFPSSARTVRFGVFEVDLRAGEVRKRGVKVKLQGQPFLLLVALLKRQGDLVTRDELRATLWPEGTFIDFDHSLGTAVNKLREVLGDSAANPRFIETLPKRGYRFIAPIEWIGEAADMTEPVPEPVPTEPEAPDRRRPAWAIYGVAIGVLLAGAAVWIYRSANPMPPVIRSLAVLPLENLSHDPSQEYFSDGMTDELITELGQISELRVISRTSAMTYKGARRPLPRIAQELNVDAVVEGTVLRSGNRVRITAQLIQASTDEHLWAHSYEGELRDALALQQKVARAIAEQIRIKLNPREQIQLKNARAVNTEAHEAYLKGRYFWNKRTGDGFRKALEYFNEAIEKDPGYAQAYSGLADSYALMGDWEYGVLAPQDAMPKAKAAATTALTLDSTLGEAHTSLAFSLDLFDWDWTTAEKEFRRAVELNPSYATAHQWYAWHLIVQGRNAEAVGEMRRAQSLDPLSLIISADLADILLIARLFEESIRQSRKTMEMDPNFAVAHFQLGQAYVQTHRYDEGIAELKKALSFSGGNKTFASNLAYAYAVSGNRGAAEQMLKDLEKPSDENFPNASEIAMVHIGLDQKDEAMTWLEKAYSERSNPSVLFRPCFDPLRSDPRFRSLLHRVGLSQ